ncbi:hypothetical protein KC19_VG021800 [Ceratodon purpureus]|uniref:Uncharacterized protein n=1 Tax=Ceratodon purpureus TaxID=3225 RepID=A0A8T0HL75_CERPU|nr:hypothetical protein KC19_VG021800 [Ceratodon purpureus]
MGSGTSRHQRANNTTGDKTGEEVAAVGNVSRVHDDDVDHVEKEGDVSHDIRVNETTEGATSKNAMHSVTTSMQFRSTLSIRQPVPVEEIYQSISTDDDDNGHERSRQRSRSPVKARGISKENTVLDYLQRQPEIHIGLKR